MFLPRWSVLLVWVAIALASPATAGTVLWVGDGWGGTLQGANLNFDGTPTAFQPQLGTVWGLAIDPDTQTVYVNDALTVNVATYTLPGLTNFSALTLPVDAGATLMDLALATGRLWTVQQLNGAGVLEGYLLADPADVVTHPLSFLPVGVAFDGSAFWISDDGGALHTFAAGVEGAGFTTLDGSGIAVPAYGLGWHSGQLWVGSVGALYAYGAPAAGGSGLADQTIALAGADVIYTVEAGEAATPEPSSVFLALFGIAAVYVSRRRARG